LKSKPLYKTQEAKQALMDLYDSKLNSLQLEYEDIYVNSFAGSTHVVKAGNSSNPPLVILHGINAGAPIALESVKGLAEKYLIYAIETIGQTTKSSETRLNLQNDEYGRWLSETFDQLNLQSVPVIGASYGGFLLQKLITFYPKRVSKAIFVVPAGFGNGSFLESTKKLTMPLIKFMITKKESDLKSFMNSFYNKTDDYSLSFQKNTLTGVNMDFRRPPLLKKEEVRNFESPVYLMVADNDVFFPAEISIRKCKAFFNNFKETYTLENSKHIPEPSQFSEIESVISNWLE
jgi:pimeloyl-ACP methyl ester carboxylesterase